MAYQNEKRQYRANLAGKNYTISGHASLPHFKATETLFNKQMMQIKTVAPKLAPVDQLTLLTFNALSDQLYKQAEVDALQQQVAKLEAEIAQLQQAPKTTAKRTPRNAIRSIIDDAKQESHARTTDKLFKQGTNT